MATVQRWGNSLALRVPKPLAAELGLQPGSEVRITVEAGRLVVAPERPRRTALAELLARCTPENRPETVEFGPPVGREMI